MNITDIVNDYAPAPSPPPQKQDYEKMNVNELKEELQKRGLKKSGNKPDLIARLEEDDNGKGPRTEWEPTDTPMQNIPRQFKTEDVGPVNVSHSLTPLQCWLLFWDDIIDPVVDAMNTKLNDIQTIRRARRQRQRERRGKKAKGMGKAVVVTRVLFMAWLAMWLQMFLCHMSEFHKYWEKRGGDEFIKNSMRRDDWLNMNVVLFHLGDEILESVEEKLNKNFRKYWKPGRKVAIDESMRKFKGRWKGKVYIKNKPTKWGLKFYMLVDSFYYCVWFRLYRGKAKEDPTVKEKTRHLCNTALDTLPKDMGSYAVYADNYYGSLDLARDTNDRGFAFTFNCRSNRPTWLFGDGIHKQMKEKDGVVGKVGCWVHKSEQLAAVSWTDTKTVNFLTNQFTTETAKVKRRQNGNEDKTEKIIPKVAQDYTEGGMGQVDAFDAALSRFRHFKSTSWRRCHFLSMIKFSIVNAWVLYCFLLRRRGEFRKAKRLTLNDFMRMLAQELVAPHQGEKRKREEEKQEARKKRRNKQQQARRKKAKEARREDTPFSHFRVNRDVLLQKYLNKLNVVQ